MAFCRDVARRVHRQVERRDATERLAAHEHFLDLCALLGVPKPAEIDRHGTEYTFEKSTRKIGDTQGFADVWWRGRFAWEYKGHRRNLVEAYAQLKQYALARLLALNLDRAAAGR